MNLSFGLFKKSAVLPFVSELTLGINDHSADIRIGYINPSLSGIDYPLNLTFESLFLSSQIGNLLPKIYNGREVLAIFEDYRFDDSSQNYVIFSGNQTVTFDNIKITYDNNIYNFPFQSVSTYIQETDYIIYHSETLSSINGFFRYKTADFGELLGQNVKVDMEIT